MCEDIGGAESTMKESDVKDLDEWMSIKDIEEKDVYCCSDNHVWCCNPGRQDDKHCNSLCLNHPCGKGGRCKVFGHKNPRHFCHCFC